MGGLVEAMTQYELKEGLLLTYDVDEERKIKDKKGKEYLIKILPVWKWLLTG